MNLKINILYKYNLKVNNKKHTKIYITTVELWNNTITILEIYSITNVRPTARLHLSLSIIAHYVYDMWNNQS